MPSAGRQPLSEPVFFSSQIKSGLAAFHDPLNCVPDDINVDRAFAGDCASRLISGRPVVAPSNKLRVAIHHKVRIVTREDQLSLLFRLPNSFNDFQHHRVVQVFFRLMGTASLLVADDELEGTPAVVVVLDASGHVIAKQPTIIGGDD